MRGGNVTRVFAFIKTGGAAEQEEIQLHSLERYIRRYGLSIGGRYYGESLQASGLLSELRTGDALLVRNYKTLRNGDDRAYFDTVDTLLSRGVRVFTHAQPWNNTENRMPLFFLREHINKRLSLPHNKEPRGRRERLNMLSAYDDIIREGLLGCGMTVKAMSRLLGVKYGTLYYHVRRYKLDKVSRITDKTKQRHEANT